MFSCYQELSTFTQRYPSFLGQKKPANGLNTIKKIIQNNKIILSQVGNDLNKNLSNLHYINSSFSNPKINIGGDHSMSIATVAHSLRRNRHTKIVWIDAHADINTYEMSSSKNLHGMPLSFLSGLDKEVKFSFLKRYLNLDNLYYIGLRDLDDFENYILQKYKIKQLSVEDFNKEKWDNLFEFIDEQDIHLSLDVDSLDPSYIPSTGTPVKQGLKLPRVLDFLDNINSNVYNIDLVELNTMIGNKKDVKKSIKNTRKLFKKLIQL